MTARAGEQWRTADPARAASDAAPSGRLARIDLARIRENLRIVRRTSGRDEVLVQVPGDAYGHGAPAVCSAALDAGATAFVTGTAGEAVRLRSSGVDAPLIAWQLEPGEDFASFAALDITPAIPDAPALERAIAAGVRAVHLVPDLGGPQLGAAGPAWRDLCEIAARAESSGGPRVTGVMASLPEGSEASAAAARQALAAASAAGLSPRTVHLADREPGLGLGILSETAVRIGAALYGLSARPGGVVPTRPVLTLTAPVLAVKEAPAGVGVSYGYTYVTPRATELVLVPLGYGDGIPRRSGNRARARLDGTILPVVGRVAMDALVLDAAALLEAGRPPRVGETVTVISDDGEGCSARDWAERLETSSLDIVSRLTARVTRSVQ